MISPKKLSGKHQVSHWNSLRQWVFGQFDHEKSKSGVFPNLPLMAEFGNSYTWSEVVDIASEYAVSLEQRQIYHPFSEMVQRPVSKPRALSAARVKSILFENCAMNVR